MFIDWNILIVYYAIQFHKNSQTTNDKTSPHRKTWLLHYVNLFLHFNFKCHEVLNIKVKFIPFQKSWKSIGLTSCESKADGELAFSTWNILKCFTVCFTTGLYSVHQVFYLVHNQFCHLFLYYCNEWLRDFSQMYNLIILHPMQTKAIIEFEGIMKLILAQ